MTPNIPKGPAELRIKAEAQMARASKLLGTPTPAEEMLHELQVYQIELEMQNEELRQSQVELEKSRDRYVDFYDFSPVGYLTLNHDAMIDEINLTGSRLLGAERSKLLRSRFSSCVSPEYRERWNRHFMSVLMHDNKDNCELLLQRKDGSTFFARLLCSNLESSGKKSVVRIVLTDITDRKLAEVNLSISPVAFEVQESLMITDANHLILRVNKAFIKSTGYSSEEAIGRTPSQLQLITNDAGFYSEMLKIAQSTGTWYGEVWGKRKNGETYSHLANSLCG